MNVFLLGVFVVLSLASNSIVRGDEDNENDLERRYFGQRCSSHQGCKQHQYCKWYGFCKNLPKCKTRCFSGMTCKSSNSFYRRLGQCVRSSMLCSSHGECDQASECCKSNHYFHYCAKRPQEGERCCPRFFCYKCAEGLVCKRGKYQLYGICQSIPTTVKPTEEGSGEYDRGLLE